MERRLRDVENALAGIKPTLDRLDRTLEKIGDRLVSQEASQATLIERISASVRLQEETASSISKRIEVAERNINSALTTAVSRSVSWWQFPAVIVGTGAALLALQALYIWMTRQPWWIGVNIP